MAEIWQVWVHMIIGAKIYHPKSTFTGIILGEGVGVTDLKYGIVSCKVEYVELSFMRPSKPNWLSF